MIPFLHIGWLSIPTYGLMVAIGMIVAYYTLRADLARRGIAPKSSALAETLIAIPCFAGLVGSKIYSVLETPREFFADPWHQLFSQYGFTWFGGMLGGFILYVWLALKQPLPLLTMLDASAPAATFGYALGRMGCLFSGDGDYGIPTSLPWGMSFPNGLVPTVERVHPTPVYEFIVACLTAWLLWRMGRSSQVNAAAGGSKPPTQAKARQPGEVFATYLVLTGVARFLVEFIRINPRSFWGLTNAQVVSAISIVAGAALWWRVRKD